MRLQLRVSIALIGVLACSLLGLQSVGARTSDESGFLSKANAERTSRGIGALAWSEDLAAVARNHSNEMAQRDELYHNPRLANEVDGWEELGENVGYGNSVPELHDAFMASNVHREAILHGRFTKIGIGTTWRDGVLWVTEVFERPFGSPQSSSTKKVVRKPKSSPPRRSGGRTLRSPAAPAAAPAAAVRPPGRSASPVGDLTRIMVVKLLGAEEPALRSFHQAGEVSAANLAGSVFRIPPRLLPLGR
jgi:cysteine-rich secretory family protein